MSTRSRKQTVLNGDNVFVRNPQRIIPDCLSITGDVVHIATRKKVKWATIRGYIAKMGGGYEIDVSVRYEDLGIRIGTPISRLSGRPGHPGFARFCEIARSWGHE